MDTPLSDEQKEYMDSLILSANNLMTIINDILDFSKIEAGKITFESIPFRLKSYLESAMQPFQVKAEEKNIGFTMNISEDIPEIVIGDPVRLCQVLNNLIGNAIKFTSIGGVSMECNLENRGIGEVSLRFLVADTGIGIPPDAIATVFDKFTQADASTTRLYGGTGLGLSITKRLTDLMGGDISAKSIEGRGSTFSVTLTFGLSRSGEPAPTWQEKSDADIACKPLRVLVVDDIPLNQLISSKIIEKSGDHDIECACNGQEALAKWEHGDYDLIFMDVQMPVMDGLQATREIRSREEGGGRRIHICAMTANAMKDDMAQCLEAGMDSYITKPIREENIYEIIRKIGGKGESSGRSVEKNDDQPAGTEVKTEAGDDRPADLNLQELLERLDGEESCMPKFLGMFIDMAIERISNLGDAISKGDCKAVRMEAHALKGASASIAAEKMRVIAGDIESAAGENLLIGVEGRYETLKEAFEAFKNVAGECLARISV